MYESNVWTIIKPNPNQSNWYYVCWRIYLNSQSLRIYCFQEYIIRLTLLLISESSKKKKIWAREARFFNLRECGFLRKWTSFPIFWKMKMIFSWLSEYFSYIVTHTSRKFLQCGNFLLKDIMSLLSCTLSFFNKKIIDL